MQTATFYLIYKVLHIAPKLLRPKFLQLQKERLMKSPECIKHLMWHDDREVHPYYMVLFCNKREVYLYRFWQCRCEAKFLLEILLPRINISKFYHIWVVGWVS